MDLTQRTEKVAGDGREFLKTTVGLEYKAAGITLKGAAFTGEVVKGGTAVYRDADGLFIPVAVGATAPFDGACLTAHAVKRPTSGNPIVGAIVKCSADRSRCTGVTDTFAAHVRGRINFDL